MWLGGVDGWVVGEVYFKAVGSNYIGLRVWIQWFHCPGDAWLSLVDHHMRTERVAQLRLYNMCQVHIIYNYNNIPACTCHISKSSIFFFNLTSLPRSDIFYDFSPKWRLKVKVLSYAASIALTFKLIAWGWLRSSFSVVVRSTVRATESIDFYYIGSYKHRL